ncbi:MAG: hypothetical protein ABIC40_05190 [bacterium]
MKELVILVLCFVLYVVAIEVYEAKTETSKQGRIVPQEQSFNYTPPSPPTSSDGTPLKTGFPTE